MAKNKIYIDPSKRGTFTSAANKRNKTVKQFTDMVLNNKDEYSPKMVRKAIFARNASKWNKKREGGDIVSTMGYRDDSPFRNSGSLNIYSPEGFIDMSNVGMPIMANGQRLEPYSGLNQVPPSKSGYVKETPLMVKYGGSVPNIPTYYQDSGTPIYRDTTDAPPTVYQKGGNLLTYKNNSDYFDSHAVYHDNPDYNDLIRKRVYSGKWGYDPTTQQLHKLNKSQQTKVDPKKKKLALERKKEFSVLDQLKLGNYHDEELQTRYNSIQEQYLREKGLVPHIIPNEDAWNPYGKDLAGTTQWVTPERDKEMWREQVAHNVPIARQQMANLFSIPASFTPIGMSIMGMQGATNLATKSGPEFIKNPSWSTAGTAGLDFLIASPLTIPAVKNIPTGKLNAPKSFKSEINWGKWNKDIPKNKPLMDEYRSIEHRTKKAGTWMKNPDGSKFTGTPEQFVQQQSQNFKKAFGKSKLVNPDGSPMIIYHGSPKRFEAFDESMFQLGDSGFSGSGIYTTPTKSTAESYTLSGQRFHSGDIEPTLYELYGKGNNPITSKQLIDNSGGDIGFGKVGELKDKNLPASLFNFHRKGTPKIDRLLDYDVAIKNQQRGISNIRPIEQAWEIVFPTNKQLKSAIGNDGMFDMTNPNIYKSLLPIGGAAGIMGATVNDEVNTKQKGGNIYNVKSGDTFYGIANRHNMSKQNLIDANPGININALKLNQPINIPLRPADGLEYQVYNNKGKSYRPDHFYRKAGNYWQIKGPNTGGKYVTITDPTRLSNIDRDARVFEDPRYIMPKELPQEYLDHLRLREGIRNKSYLDSEGKLTGGIGHLMSSAEKKQYPLGTIIPPSLIEKWYKEDSKKAYKAALKQAKELKVDNPKFINSLASVNFQLGPAWNTKHTKTWDFLKEGKFKEAAIEAADSKWNTQTPKRVKDFQEGIRTLINSKKYGGTMISKENNYQDGGPISPKKVSNNNKYFNIEGVNTSKLQQWYNLGKEAPTSINEAFLLAEAVGYPPSQAKIVAAQWALESTHGRSVLATKQNNFFGIKSHSESVRKRLANKYGLNVFAGPKYQTEEDIGGKRIKQKSSFMTFDDPVAGFLAHKAFLETNSRYKKALKTKTSSEFATALDEAKYATGADYLKALRNTAKPLLDEKEFNNFNIVGSTKVKSDKEPIKSKSDKTNAQVFNSLPEQQKNIIANSLSKDQRFNVLNKLKSISGPITLNAVDYEIQNVMNQNVKLDKKNPYIDKLDISMPAPKQRVQFGQGQLFRKYGGIIKNY